MMRYFWGAFGVLLVAGQCAAGPCGDPNHPRDLVETKWGAIIEVLKNAELDEKAKSVAIDKIASPIFDFGLMAKLSLGKKHWPKFTGPERLEFTNLFAQRLKDSYFKKVSLYTDETVLMKPEIKDAKNKDIMHVPMALVSEAKETAMLYKFRRVEKCWLIYDVEIAGVSLILTYRSQFNDILSKGTVRDLLDRLKDSPPS